MPGSRSPLSGPLFGAQTREKIRALAFGCGRSIGSYNSQPRLSVGGRLGHTEEVWLRRDGWVGRHHIVWGGDW